MRLQSRRWSTSLFALLALALMLLAGDPALAGLARRVNLPQLAPSNAVLASPRAQGGGLLQLNRLQSFQATTVGTTGSYLRHSSDLGVIDPVSASSTMLVKQDATFRVVAGLANSSCYSFEARNFPGQYLRHSSYRIRKDPNDGSALFKADATFCAQQGLGGPGVSFEASNLPGYYIRHYNNEVWIANGSGGVLTPWNTPAMFSDDVTWKVVPAWWRSDVDLPAGQLRSLQTTKPGDIDRYLRHNTALGVVATVNALTDRAIKQEASFQIVAGLADESCYSFKAYNATNQYLRHSSYRIRNDTNNGTALFRADATFCAQKGLGGAGVSFEALNAAGRYIRQYNNEVWVADGNGGADPWNTSVGFSTDATWSVAPAVWKSDLDLVVGQFRSLQVTIPGYTDFFLRQQGYLGEIAQVALSSADTLKQDATFRIVAGLAENSCYSFESRRYPGYYLRHSDRIYLELPAGDVQEFHRDATFCAKNGLTGSGVSFESLNEPGGYIRHYYGEVWLATKGGPNSWDSPVSFEPDATWGVLAPWAP